MCVCMVFCIILLPSSGSGYITFLHRKKSLLKMTEYILICAHRMEDLTDPEAIRVDPKCDRTVSLYGYLRGTFLKNKGQVHIPGKSDQYSHTEFVQLEISIVLMKHT